jgi:hypothetical protein
LIIAIFEVVDRDVFLNFVIISIHHTFGHLVEEDVQYQVKDEGDETTVNASETCGASALLAGGFWFSINVETYVSSKEVL